MNIRIRLLAPLFAALVLAACGGSDISGTWAKTDSALTVKFDHGKAWISGLNSMGTTEGTYKVSGDKIVVDGPGGHPHLTFTRNDDGTLHFDNLGGTLTRASPGE